MRKIETLTFSENRESLLDFMNNLRIPDFQIKIRDLDEYITASLVLSKLGFPEDTHWGDGMLNKLLEDEFDFLSISVNPAGYTLVSPSDRKKFDNVKDFIKSDIYFYLTQREFITIED